VSVRTFQHLLNFSKLGSDLPLAFSQFSGLADRAAHRSSRSPCQALSHPGLENPSAFFYNLPQGLLKPPPVIVINNDVFPAISPCHHVVNRPRILDALFSPHWRDRMAVSTRYVN
jgi:hypothetical protein